MIYAKSYIKEGIRIGETLEEHTKILLDELKRLKELYRDKIERVNLRSNFWELLYIACLLHDLGKASSSFQEKIRGFLEGKTLEGREKKEIYHNYLSVAFLKHLQNLDEESLILLFYAIAFHHNRSLDFSEDELKKTVEEDIANKTEDLKWTKNFGIEIRRENLWSDYYMYLDENINTYRCIRKDKNYIILKGLLHRLDHSASAHLPVEERRIDNLEDKLISYLRRKFGSRLKPFQERAKYLRDSSLLLTASTGMGKTEFAINWIGEDKAFYTLPLRVSVNAMYKRFTDIFKEDNIGLLHSDSLIYGLDELKNDDKVSDEVDSPIIEHIHRVNITRQLSMPITITTADQLFTAVFKWKGYEKIYATLAYSKVIVDEPQSYSANILAFIIKAIQEISKLGGRFCIMSATTHPFLKKYLDKYCEILEPVYNLEKKHKIKLEECSIDQLIPDIVKAYERGKKVLVISNTIKESQNLYEQLSKKLHRVNLLHSGFIQRDRIVREKEIKKDSEEKESIVWVTTQIAEVSLDIDYDILFTEIATIDSIIQRMGRVYRKVNRVIKDKDDPNIIIATETPSDNFHIYDREIVDLTKSYIKEFNQKIITEEEKQELMNQIFNMDKVKNTKFYENFERAFKLLDNGFEIEDKTEAQNLFRDIANLTVIPEEVYEENYETVEKCLSEISDKELPLSKRLVFIKDLNDLTVSIPIYKAKGKILTEVYPKKGIYVIKAKYDKNKGLITHEGLEKLDYII